jgi:hypothetical protein
MSKEIAIKSATDTLALRKNNMRSAILRLANDSESMAAQLRIYAAKIENAENTADGDFIDAIAVIENFNRNVNIAQAMRLAVRYASAETDLNNLLG